MVLYNSSASAASRWPARRQSRPKPAWRRGFRGRGRAGDAVLDLGAPIQPSGRISASGISVTDSQASGYSLLQANSKEEIDALLEKHPHLKMPGASIDVFEALPIPGGRPRHR